MAHRVTLTLTLILALTVLSQTRAVAQNQDQPTLAPLPAAAPPEVELDQARHDGPSAWEKIIPLKTQQKSRVKPQNPLSLSNQTE